MFITPAMAQTAAPGGSNIILQLMPFILIFAIMYFLIIRPQQKRLKAHREMVSNVKRGDTVVTAGGLVGKVASVVDDDEIRVDIADGVRVNVVRNTLSEVRPKGEVRGAEKAAKQPAKKTEQIEEDAEEPAAEEQDAPAAETAKSANGATKKPGARSKSRQAGASGGARKSGGASKSGSATRKPRSRAKSGNGASTGGSKETGGDNA
ncbi:MAG: preprotein translocase subunit YajC [Dichotomicrobium sp.]